MERVGLEACLSTAWLHAGLTEAGLPAICIEARQAEAAMGAMPHKTDRNDARGIAQIIRTGWYRAVHVKSPARVRELAADDPVLSSLAELLLSIIEAITREAGRLTKRRGRGPRTRRGRGC